MVSDINNRCCRYEEMSNIIKRIDHYEPVHVTDANEVILKKLLLPQNISDITCSYLSNTSCKLTWKNEGYKYTVKMQESSNQNWKNVISGITSDNYVINDMKTGVEYKFLIQARNDVG